MDLIAPKSPAVVSGIINVLSDFPIAEATSIWAFRASRETIAVGFFSSEPLFGSAFFEEIMLIQIFTSTGVLGLISGIYLYRQTK